MRIICYVIATLVLICAISTVETVPVSSKVSREVAFGPAGTNEGLDAPIRGSSLKPPVRDSSLNPGHMINSANSVLDDAISGIDKASSDGVIKPNPDFHTTEVTPGPDGSTVDISPENRPISPDIPETRPVKDTAELATRREVEARAGLKAITKAVGSAAEKGAAITTDILIDAGLLTFEMMTGPAGILVALGIDIVTQCAIGAADHDGGFADRLSGCCEAVINDTPLVFIKDCFEGFHEGGPVGCIVEIGKRLVTIAKAIPGIVEGLVDFVEESVHELNKLKDEGLYDPPSKSDMSG
ncbi:hypothetical protein HDU86_007573 [Geranomyces michiganensis]|nr:hypothetical protein HDU86_007573 [Geranomyces michiganensis]